MRKMTSDEIRETWLNFFKSKGHHVEPGSSLIPNNDPTLLWINAGVAALKKYFDGSEIPPSRRITNAQKSIRTNDIENVGKTDRHHTFFEMLGNFSIGDYFRKEAIAFAGELLFSEQYFGFPREKLYMTYFPDDIETKNCWLAQGVNEDHLIPLEGNFWEIGEGPCGPDTEMFFDRGEKYDPQHLGVKLLKEDIENDRYIEIWNIVLSQFNSQPGIPRSEYKELPSKNIDTGAGLERFACIIQGTESNFETDLFWPIIEKVQAMSHKDYWPNKMAFRVIADHIRSCTFALSDGAAFSNEGRGYVLRRLIRRAERYGRVLGINHPFLYELVDVVCDIMKNFYPYLLDKKEFVKKMIKAEEDKFIKTLSNGEALLKKAIEGKDTLPAEEMFKLYDTYGFPKELTMEMCEENGVKVDLDGFNKLMNEQKERARNARSDAQSMNKQSKDLLEFVTPSTFNYKSEPVTSKVIGLFVNGEKVDSLSLEGDVAFEETNFYAESGGQISDSGVIENNECAMNVVNVFKAPNKQHLHHVNILFGEVKVGETFTLKIDQRKRSLITKNHSSVHLLQKALTDVLGDHVAQHGSYVCDEYSRFDFSHFTKVSEEQLHEVERKVNQWIMEGIEEETKVLPIEEAKKLGARALFNDKYGDVVRVVCFGDVSKEFCGGTHVNNTSELGVFAIESEEAIASGVRRIQARTSIYAYELLKKKENQLIQVRNALSAKGVDEVKDRLNALINERNDLKKENETLANKVATLSASSLKNEFKNINGIQVLIRYVKGNDRSSLIGLIDHLKTAYQDNIIVLIGGGDNNLPIVCSVNGSALEKFKAGLIVKEIAGILNGSGGGRPDMASGAGKDATKIANAIDKFNALIK